MSRNKREGHYDGVVLGKHQRMLRNGKPAMLWSRSSLPLNRKQRKIAKIKEDGYWSNSFYSHA